jgi:phosphoribosyl-dephospho-CoA transferase
MTRRQKSGEPACSHNMVTLEERMLHDPAGATLLMALQGDPNEIKGIAVALEDFKPWGRLLDLDVFSAFGEQVNRSSSGPSLKKVSGM